jgi:dTDP-4-dehydrorhamnose reductase|tara:strand:+ start:302 stop:1135 length:834 start_codon:yes stop_codon:yes gene_type:complete
MGFSGTNRHWFIIGAEFPVGQCLADLASELALPYSSRRLDSREPLSIPLGTASAPLAILSASGEDANAIEHLEAWITRLIEQDIPIVLLSSAKVFAYNELGSLENDAMTGDERLISIENQVRQQLRHLIVRVNQPFSLLTGDYAVQMLAKARSQGNLTLDNLIRIAPTPADDIAQVIHALLQQIDCDESLWGTYHYCSVESTTEYAFAEVLLAEARQYEDLAHVTLKELDDDKCQPSETILDSKLIKHNFGIKAKPWRKALSRLIRRYYRADDKKDT